ncbi:unnamed protein product [Notodromas monacha]|uniref:Uncharacterized protein n=1 Tax=Notodromas monacha TaxID=399045 RepID=A0A7R9BE50_9CRUS|nr:unnamed protein product [Notodromas monacha]CAG0913665.1 unnamed protein product [Notodromas monacha]
MSRRRGFCGCCTALRPHYKRLVDDIFPPSADMGLQKNNMEKLTFYALSSPEKLDRIGEYIALRLMRDLGRRRPGFVEIAMDAMDQLLVACHAQSLNLFVESFLKTVQKLLESPDPRMQIRASQSFVKFANIKEDTPSYHLRYDFLVSKFSAMCHDGNLDNEVRMNIRMAGLRGLQGVVRKTVGDDLLESIWEPNHMNKIVPSLVYNMQTGVSYGRSGESASGQSAIQMDSRMDRDAKSSEELEGETPESLAEVCLRELAGRAPYGKLETVLSAVLTHMDNHRLWDPNEFAVQVFRVVMFSIQSKYSQSVIQALIAHLDKQTKSGPRLRTAIADVIAKVIAIAAGESVGLSPLEIISSLLTQLKRAVLAVERTKEMSPFGEGNEDDEETDADVTNLRGSFHNKGHLHLQEERYQATLINALGEYANHLPDYQKIEVMKFVIGKIPERLPNSRDLADETAMKDEDANLLLRKILLKSMLKVGTKYITLQFSQTFQMNLLEPLLRMAVSPHAEIRLLIQHIMHTLIDRHDNLTKLQQLTINPGNLQLRVEQCSSSDLQFFKKRGPDMFLCLYGALDQTNNTEENIRAVHTTVALICIEMKGPESQIEALRFLFGVQDVAEEKEHEVKDGRPRLSALDKLNLHAFVASSMNLLSHMSGIEEFVDYTQHVTQRRLDHSPLMLPPLRSSTLLTKDREMSGDLLFDRSEVIGILQRAEVDSSKLEQPYPTKAPSQHSWLDKGRSMSRKGSQKRTSDDAVSGSGSEDFNEGDSFESSSLGRSKKVFHLPGHKSQEVSFEAFKRLVNEPSDVHKEAELARGREIAKMFQNMTFNELLSRQPSVDDLQCRLADIFQRINGSSASHENLLGVGGSPRREVNSEIEVPFLAGELEFPELYVY